MSIELSVAAGGLLTGVEQGDTTGTQHPLYMGAGLQAEARFSFYSPIHPSLKIALLGTVHDSHLSNVNTAASESDHHFGYGGGLEFGYKWFFIGVQGEAVSSTVTAHNFTLGDLHFGEFGLRTGVNIALNKRFSLTLGLLSAFDQTKMTGNTGTVVSSTGGELRTFLLLRFTFFRPKAVWDLSSQTK